MKVSFTFVEQEVDGGETLFMVAEYASTEQLNACGVTTLRRQMKLKKLVTPSIPAATLPSASYHWYSAPGHKCPKLYVGITSASYTQRTRDAYRCTALVTTFPMIFLLFYLNVNSPSLHLPEHL